MYLVEKLRAKLRAISHSDTSIQTVEEGHNSLNQGDLPGEKSVVINTGTRNIYLPVRDGKVGFPKIWRTDSQLAPDDKTVALTMSAVIQNTEYSVEYQPFFKDKNGDYLCENSD